MFQFTLASRNAKTGPMPVTTSSKVTCPQECPLKGNGCYADGGPLAILWRKVTAGLGITLDALCDSVARLQDGTVWRHNQAGDLPGEGNHVDREGLGKIVKANRRKRGFTFTHKPVLGAAWQANREAIADANSKGFTINLSANTLAHADQLANLSIGPVVVVLDAVDGERADTVTPEGRKVVTCPATYRPNVTCLSCQLCTRANRQTIVGFPVHGVSKRKAATVARG